MQENDEIPRCEARSLLRHRAVFNGRPVKSLQLFVYSL